MLALDKREFIYKFHYEIIEPTSHANLIDFAVEDWSDINKLKELQAEANRHAITKLKDYSHENNVSFVGVLTIILTITVIAGSLFLCYYFQCYSTIYSKILSFYQRTRKSKRNTKKRDVVLFKNISKPEEPHVSEIPSADLEAIKPDLDERNKARNQPSPVLSPKTTSKDATSNRITLDF